MSETKIAFSEHLNDVCDNIEKFIDNLNKVHNQNMKILIDMYEACIGKLYAYKTQIDQIQMAIHRPQPNVYFEKISEISLMNLSELEEEKKMWKLNDPKFKVIETDYYKFDEFKIFNFWQPAEVQPCGHNRTRVIVTCCKKAHCVECLKSLINQTTKNCPCGYRLSPKNVHEAMGYNFNIDYLFH